jgi:hypothetical protein
MALSSGRSRIASVASLFRDIGIGVLATLLFIIGVGFYELLVVGGSYYGMTSTWLAMLFVGYLGTFGLPVVLWFRYELKAPLVFMSLVLLFYVLMPVFGGGGDAPLSLFLVVFAPIFVGIYVLLAGLEYLLRFRKKKGLAS